MRTFSSFCAKACPMQFLNIKIDFCKLIHSKMASLCLFVFNTLYMFCLQPWIFFGGGGGGEIIVKMLLYTVISGVQKKFILTLRLKESENK